MVETILDGRKKKMAANIITPTALGLSNNVRNVNAPVRSRLGMIRMMGSELIDTRRQPANLRMTGEARIDHLGSYDIPKNYSVGVWYFPKGSTRFHEGYEDVVSLSGDAKGSEKWVEWTFEKAAKIQNELGAPLSLQAHYPNELGPQNVAKWVQMMEQTGIGVDSIVPFLFGPAKYQHGSLTNPNKSVRQDARQTQLETFQMAKMLGIPTVNHWLGIDGFENPFGQDITWMLDQIEGATADAMNEAEGQQATFEPKPYEPRAHNIVALTHDGLLLAQGIEKRLSGLNVHYLGQGIRMVGMTPEIGHMKMAFEVLPKSFEQVLREGRLFCIHWNGQPDGNYDVDENPGTYSFESVDQIAYVLQRAGFAGVHTLDINPLRMSLESAVMIGFLNLSAAFEAAKKAPHRLIQTAVANPENDGNAVIQLLQLAERRPNSEESHTALARVHNMGQAMKEPELD